MQNDTKVPLFFQGNKAIIWQVKPLLILAFKYIDKLLIYSKMNTLITSNRVAMPENPDDYINNEEHTEGDDSELSSEEGEEEIDENKRRLLCGLGALAISLPFLALGIRKSCLGLDERKTSKEKPAPKETPKRGYFGTWKYSEEARRLTISPTRHQPEKELVINGHKATLLMSASIKNFYQYPREQVEMSSAPGGIYRVDGKQEAFIAKHSGSYLVIGLVRNNNRQIVVTDENHGYYPANWLWYTLRRVSR